MQVLQLDFVADDKKWANFGTILDDALVLEVDAEFVKVLIDGVG